MNRSLPRSFSEVRYLALVVAVLAVGLVLLCSSAGQPHDLRAPQTWTVDEAINLILDTDDHQARRLAAVALHANAARAIRSLFNLQSGPQEDDATLLLRDLHQELEALQRTYEGRR